MDTSAQEILLLWLSQVRYIFRHKNHEHDIWPSWGLRQGCTGSPVVWAAFTALLTRAIDLRIQQHWSREHATLCADDSHLRWTFTIVAEFDQAITELRCTCAVFRRLGMQVPSNIKFTSSTSASKVKTDDYCGLREIRLSGYFWWIRLST